MDFIDTSDISSVSEVDDETYPHIAQEIIHPQIGISFSSTINSQQKMKTKLDTTIGDEIESNKAMVSLYNPSFHYLMDNSLG